MIGFTSFVFPDDHLLHISITDNQLPSFDRKLEIQDLIGLTKSDLRMLRNSYFARHGYVFNSADLQEYFERFDWYERVGKEAADHLTALDNENIGTIGLLEDRFSDYQPERIFDAIDRRNLKHLQTLAAIGMPFGFYYKGMTPVLYLVDPELSHTPSDDNFPITGDGHLDSAEIDILKLLVEHGGRLTDLAKRANGWTADGWSAYALLVRDFPNHQNMDLIRWMLNRGQFEDVDPSHWISWCHFGCPDDWGPYFAPLNFAIDNNLVELTRLFAEYSADIAENAGLNSAISTGNVELVKILLEYGARVGTASFLVLFDAVRSRNVDMVRFVIDNGAVVDGAPYDLLSLSSWQGSLDIVQYLLDYGMEPTSDSIVHAVYAGNEDVVKELLSAGGAMPSDDEEFEMARWDGMAWPQYYQPSFATIGDAIARSGIDLSSILGSDSSKLNLASPRQIAVVRQMFATSALPDEGPSFRYGPDQAFDGNPATAWNEGTDGNGVGEVFAIHFAEPVKINRIEFMAGYFDERWFSANCRVKSMEINLFEGEGNTVYRNSIDLADEMIAHALRLGRIVEITHAEFTINTVYPGSKWNDLAFAEVQFFVDENHIELDMSNADVVIGK